jgi:hypothetical protein
MKLTEIDSEVALSFLGYRTGSELLFSPPTTDRPHYFSKEHWKLFCAKGGTIARNPSSRNGSSRSSPTVSANSLRVRKERMTQSLKFESENCVSWPGATPFVALVCAPKRRPALRGRSRPH